ncbi:DUF2922 domain-containing protein [Pelosinus sp. sgz500959]|uniref:DUF2922 domain-containing protein n=1 Tax=Pelosinus sp. sgz500959 TaxID=3242472 RepID=UPI00367058EC
MVKTLEMEFRNETGKSVVLRMLEPKDDITLAEVHAVMQNIIAKNIFSTTSGDLVQVVEARILSNDSLVLA